MVTPENFQQLRLMNFGFQALSSPLDPAPLLREIARYDPGDAARVCATVRRQASLSTAANFLCGVYRRIIDEPPSHDIDRSTRRTLARHRQSMRSRFFLTWLALPETTRHLLRRVPGMRTLCSRFGVAKADRHDA